MPKAQVERRSSARTPASTPVTVRHMRRQLMGRARDISDDGIFLRTEGAIEAGADIEVILRMPAGMRSRAGRWVACQAKVVRVEKEEPAGSVGIAAAIVNCEPVEIVE